jgi:hypothetical protein
MVAEVRDGDNPSTWINFRVADKPDGIVPSQSSKWPPARYFFNPVSLLSPTVTGGAELAPRLAGRLTKNLGPSSAG